jgi:hypothetical protein
MSQKPWKSILAGEIKHDRHFERAGWYRRQVRQSTIEDRGIVLRGWPEC